MKNKKSLHKELKDFNNIDNIDNQQGLRSDKIEKKQNLLEILPEYSHPFTSIDRFSFLIYSSCLHESENHNNPDVYIDNYVNAIDTFLLQNDLVETQYDYSENYRKHYKLIGDIDFQLIPKYKIREKVTDISILEIMGTDEDKTNGFMYLKRSPWFPLRIEYNPNKGDLSKIQKLLRFLNNKNVPYEKFIKVSRIDVALDYPESINLAMITCEKMYKAFICLGSNGIESVYFGSQRSKYYFRIYNKKLELQQKQKIDYQGENLFRIELQNRDGFLIGTADKVFINVFKRLKFFVYTQNTNNPELDHLLFFAKHWGLKAALSGYSPKQKTRINNLLKSIEFTPMTHPSNIFEDQFPAVWRKFTIHLETLFCGLKQDNNET